MYVMERTELLPTDVLRVKCELVLSNIVRCSLVNIKFKRMQRMRSNKETTTSYRKHCTEYMNTVVFFYVYNMLILTGVGWGL